MAKAQAIESITGNKVQDVRVINPEEIKGDSLIDSMTGGATGVMGGVGRMIVPALKSAAIASAPLAVAYGAGKAAENISWENTQGFSGNAFEQLFFRLDQLFGSDRFKQFQTAQKSLVQVDVKMHSPELKAAVKKPRGGVQ
jgi:hypothetical protein